MCFTRRSPSFDPAVAINNALNHLGEPVNTCSQTVVEYQACVWEDVPGDKRTGRVRIELRKTSGRTPSFKVKYRMDRSLIPTTSPKTNVSAKNVPASPVSQKPVVKTETVSSPDFSAAQKVALTSDPLARAKRGAAFGPDIVGLRLGMTVDKADQVIRSHKELYRMIEGNPPRPFNRALLYILAPGNEAFALFTLQDSNGERVAGVVRKVYFEPNAGPSEAGITGALENKYGAPSFVYPPVGGVRYLWLSTANEQPIKKAGPDTRACEHPIGSGSDTVWRIDQNWNAWILPWPERAWANVSALGITIGHRGLDEISRCGPTLEAEFSSNIGDLSGANLRLSLFDGAWIIASEQAMNEADYTRGKDKIDL